MVRQLRLWLWRRHQTCVPTWNALADNIGDAITVSVTKYCTTIKNVQWKSELQNLCMQALTKGSFFVRLLVRWRSLLLWRRVKAISNRSSAPCRWFNASVFLWDVGTAGVWIQAFLMLTLTYVCGRSYCYWFTHHTFIHTWNLYNLLKSLKCKILSVTPSVIGLTQAHCDNGIQEKKITWWL